jgi:hypothetical protein
MSPPEINNSTGTYSNDSEVEEHLHIEFKRTIMRMNNSNLI